MTRPRVGGTRISRSSLRTVQMLHRRGRMTAREVADALDISHSNACNRLARLQAEGLVRCRFNRNRDGSPAGRAVYIWSAA